jgi:hypothetical protein
LKCIQLPACVGIYGQPAASPRDRSHLKPDACANGLLKRRNILLWFATNKFFLRLDMRDYSENTPAQKTEAADGRKAWVAPTLTVYDVAELTEITIGGIGADLGFYSTYS